MLSRRRRPLLTVDSNGHRVVRPLSQRAERCSMLDELIDGSATRSSESRFDILTSTEPRQGLVASEYNVTQEVVPAR